MFDPKPHLITLPRRVKNQDTGLWETRHDLYLEVKWRLCWFRDRYPHGSIITEAALLDWDKGIAIYRATVEDGEGGKATGTGTETRKSFEDFVEKSETRAIGRALAALGIGTQFVGEELSEGGHIADAPAAPTNGQSHGSAAPPPVREEMAPRPAEDHPTAEQIDTLFALAESCREPKDAFGTQLRRIMGLDGSVRITKKFLREVMTGPHYQAAITFYDDMLRRQVEDDVPDYGSTPQPPDPPTAASVPTAEGTAAPFVSSSSAPEADAAERDRQRLRQEVATWMLRVNDQEVEHIITHHPYARARALLWKARLQQGNEVLVAD